MSLFLSAGLLVMAGVFADDTLWKDKRRKTWKN